MRNAFLRSFQQEFNPNLENIRRYSHKTKQEIKLAKVQADRQDQSLQQAKREAASQKRHRIRRFFRQVEVNLNTIKNDQLHQGIRQASKLFFVATNHTNSFTEENRFQLLDSLSSYNYLTPYKKACKIRHPKTTEWLFQSTTFSQ